MINRLSMMLGSAFVFTVLANVPADAAGTGKPYEAVIDNVTAGMSSKQWSDGRGRIRSETLVNGIKNVSIIDINNHVTYAINEQTKTVMKIPFNPPPEENPKIQWQNIGNKVIDGHPCSGKKGNSNGSVMEVWTGNDTNCSVLVTNNGKPVMKLKSWKATNPDPSLFALPQGYKVTDMAEMMKGMQAGGR